ncbi:MAG: PilZ domain-containing protein [Deltaproteobacteria bacterium]|nr:PilZ domain-containing protein [Deltaproteobacteria bacterium]
MRLPRILKLLDQQKTTSVPHAAQVLVFMGSEHFVCQVANLSGTGMLIFPPVEIPPNTFLRLNLELPHTNEVLDLDAFSTHDGAFGRRYAVAVRFHEIPGHSETLIRTYVRWAALHKKTHGDQLGAQAQAQPPAVRTVARRPASPAPAIGQRVGADSDPQIGVGRDTEPDLSRTLADARRQQIDAGRTTTGPHRSVTSRAPRHTPARAARAIPENVVSNTATSELEALYQAALEELASRRKTKRHPKK